MSRCGPPTVRFKGEGWSRSKGGRGRCEGGVGSIQGWGRFIPRVGYWKRVCSSKALVPARSPTHMPCTVACGLRPVVGMKPCGHTARIERAAIGGGCGAPRPLQPYAAAHAAEVARSLGGGTRRRDGQQRGPGMVGGSIVRSAVVSLTPDLPSSNGVQGWWVVLTPGLTE